MRKRLLYIGNKPSGHKSNPTAHNSLVKGLKAEGFTIYSASRLNNKILRLGHMIGSFFWNFKKYNLVLIDVYSTQNFWYAVLLGRLSAALSKKYIPILHGGDLKNRFKKSPRASEKLLKRASCIISPSVYLKKEVEKMGISSVKYIPNPLFLQKYSFRRREEFRPKLLWVRAFDRIYNPMIALKTLEILRKQYPEATLCMVGPDKDGCLETCRKYSAEKKLSVKFTGKLKKKEWTSLATGYDIFINTSDIDNTPVSVIEAMALGLPVISTNVGGIPYLIEDGETGSLVPANDPDAMANAVKLLIDEPMQAKTIATEARIKAESFDWEVIKRQWSEGLS